MKEYKGLMVPETLSEIVDPKHTLVLVQDSQNDFLHEKGYLRSRGLAKDASRLYGPMNAILSEARKRGVHVLYSSYTNYADGTSLNLPQLTAALCSSKDGTVSQPVVEDTWGWQVVDEVKPQKGERIIKKYRNDVFIGTNLELFLRNLEVRAIVHIGISIPNGILTTAWHAYNLGFYPVLPRDAAGAAIQSDEAEGWKVLERCATITTTHEIIGTWSARSE